MADFKFACPQCGQHIACDPGYSGMQINCPTCKQAIVVPQAPRSAAAPPAVPPLPPPPPPVSRAAPPALGTRQSTAAPAAGQRFAGAGAPPPPRKKTGVLKIIAAVMVALVGAAIGFFGVTYGLKHIGGGKSKGNPETEVAVPTSASTMQALSILTKVHSAYTNLSSVSADSTITLYLNLSNITVADIRPDATNVKNPNRHPPGMPRIIRNTTDLTIKRSGTNLLYFSGEAVSKVDRQNMTNTFALWKSDKGQFSYVDMHRKGMSPIYQQLPEAHSMESQAEQIKKFEELFSDPANLTKIIKNLGQTHDESVNGKDCYTLTAKVLGQKVKVWVDKSTYLIPQWQITLGGAISDADVDDAFSLVTAGFTNLPPAQLDMIKAQVEKMTPIAAKIRGTITSTCSDIQVNPALTASDFEYPVPPGVRLIQMPTMAPASSPAGSRREISQRNACINNLRQIDAAKNEWALEKGKAAGTPVTEDDLKPYLRLGPNGAFPKCPAGGTYTIGKLGEKPTCSIPGHELP